MELRHPEAFQTSGAASLGRVLDDDQLPALQGAFTEIIAQGWPGPYSTIVHDPWRKSPVVEALARHLGGIACRALEMPELVLFHDHFLEKHPGGEDMDWHQDFSYLPLGRAGGLTLWVAVTDVTEENGCLYYLYGTHQLGERRPRWGVYDDADPRGVLPPLEVDPGEAGVAAPTPAGHAIAHHAYLWHRSPANRTGKPRRSWALSFAVPEARWSPSHSPHPRSAMEPRYEGQAMEGDLILVSSR